MVSLHISATINAFEISFASDCSRHLLFFSEMAVNMDLRLVHLIRIIFLFLKTLMSPLCSKEAGYFKVYGLMAVDKDIFA